jgi:hypothetical protein
VRPEPIISNEPGSLAWHVWHERHPALVRQIVDAHPYPAPIAAALQALLDETMHGTMPAGEYAGQRWLDVPFLWAESHFYHRMMDAVGFFDDGPWRGVDPFAFLKSAELAGAPVDRLAELSLVEVMHAALWGNQADLGFRIGVTAATGSGVLGRADHLVVDDTDPAAAALDSAERVVLVADNAGREMLADLVLADHLLASGRADSVAVHVKPMPYYVSDAGTADLVACLRHLAAGPPPAAAVAARLRAAAAADRFTVATHGFHCAPYGYERMPSNLADAFAAASVVVFKGDLNYRRLVGDLRWPATVPFAETVAYFPAPVVALRTLKSDVVVGLTGDVVRRLDPEAPDWRVSGRYAMVQARI